jgi:NAD(P)-dependent dehydrogenase (short-subunit alcohol dehydrogenase family)
MPVTISDDSYTDYISRFRLTGRNYVVIGAGQGIGRQTAHALKQAGAEQVVCVDREQDRAERVASEIDGVAWVGDVTTRGEAARLRQDMVATIGKIDGLVDIVGMAHAVSVLDLDDATWDSQFTVNLRHVYHLSQELGREMVRTGGGTMVFIASAGGIYSAPGPAYAAAKASVMSWVRSLAVELGPDNVRANAVAPGAIVTPRTDARWTPEERDFYSSRSPLGRLGTPGDVASVVLFLTSDLSSYITGETLIVGGGADARGPYR